MAIGFGDNDENISGILDSLGVGDLLTTFKGTSKYEAFYNQEAGAGVLQYDKNPANRARYLEPLDPLSAKYAFIFRYKEKVIEVPFIINPQSETITEPHAYTTAHLQGGGKITQSDGCVSKEITIQGTCGLYPNTHGIAQLPTSGIGSGFEGYKMLQNVFRRYCFLKRYGDIASNLQLIYVSRRRQEAWVVEPKSFTSIEAVEHNFQHRYSIVLETLYPYDGAVSKSLVEQLLDATGLGAFTKVLDIIQQFGEAVDQLNTIVSRCVALVDGFLASVWEPLLTIMKGAADLMQYGTASKWKGITRDMMRSTVSALRTAGMQLESMGFTKEANKLFKVEKKLIAFTASDIVFKKNTQTAAKAIERELKKLATKAENLAGTQISADELIAAGAPRKPPPVTKVYGSKAADKAAADLLAVVENTKGKTGTGNDYGYQEPRPLVGTATGAATIKTKENIRAAAKSVGGSAIDGNLNFKQTVIPSDLKDVAQFLAPGKDRELSSKSFLAAWSIYAANIDSVNVDFATEAVKEKDDIKTIAQRLLGDSSLWPQLVSLNNLKAPFVASQKYIDDNKLTNVIAYGSPILYPTIKQTAESNKSVWRMETDESTQLSPFERALGSDIFVNPTTGDIAWGANDLILSYGTNTLAQQFRFKLLLKKGIYRRAPSLGLSDYVGVSTGISNVLLQIELNYLFANDPRISRVQLVGAKQIGQNYPVAVAIFVKNIQDPLLFTFSL